MPGDSTELTFVRCPSCRSLVPAMSSRCRMCGATLDAAPKADQSSIDMSKQGRVRQRTMSQASDPLSVGVEELRQAAVDVPPTAVTPPPPSRPGSEQSPEVEDPLSAYVEEVEEVQPRVGSIPSSPTPTKVDVTPAATNGHHDHPVASADPVEARTERPAVVVESGRPQGRPGGGLSFNRPEQKSERGDSRSEGRSEQASARDNQRSQQPADQRQVRQDRGQERGQERNQERAAEHPRGGRDARQEPARQEQNRPEANREQGREERRAQAPERSAKQAVQREGRLFGWLVSYSDPNGSAIEIREGKFFVSRKGLKANDLTIDDDSVSTPHAVVRAAVDSGLEVQDLMSDRGIAVKRKNGESFKKEEDRVTLSHGDWIRFGDCEYLVSLIAYPGAK